MCLVRWLLLELLGGVGERGGDCDALCQEESAIRVEVGDLAWFGGFAGCREESCTVSAELKFGLLRLVVEGFCLGLSEQFLIMKMWTSQPGTQLHEDICERV